MNKIENIRKQMSEFAPTDWESMPVIELYMDQILIYMKDQHIGLQNGEMLTSAMINNYIKLGLLPRAKGKKYSKKHVAYLSAICLLKQVLPVNDAGTLLASVLESKDIESFYGEYSERLTTALNETAAQLKVDGSREEQLDQMLEMAINSYAQMFACEQMLKALTEGREVLVAPDPKRRVSTPAPATSIQA